MAYIIFYDLTPDSQLYFKQNYPSEVNRFLMNFPIVLILLGIIFPAKCLFTYAYPTYNQTVSYFTCLKPTVNNRIIIGLQYFIYYIEYAQMMESIGNATQAGLNIQVSIQPTRCREIDEEFAYLKETLKGMNVDGFWVSIGASLFYRDPCFWGFYTKEENCEYLKKLLSEGTRLGYKMGIAATTAQWMYVFKSLSECPQLSQYRLWWTPYRQKQFPQIGGWKTPYMQTQGPTSLCGKTIYVNKVITESESGELIEQK